MKNICWEYSFNGTSIILIINSNIAFFTHPTKKIALINLFSTITMQTVPYNSLGSGAIGELNT